MSPPVVAVLCPAGRARATVASVALALASATGARCAVAAVAGVREVSSQLGSLAARRGAAQLCARGYDAAAGGRVVWVADVAGVEDDPAGGAAALALVTAGAGRALGVPAVVAMPFARSDALDRVLGWHDAVVVASDQVATPVITELARTSLAGLARPVALMPAPVRLPAAAAGAGLRATAEAVQAVTQLNSSASAMTVQAAGPGAELGARRARSRGPTAEAIDRPGPSRRRP
ncbi:MAG TPA: hypothetical protein VGM91_21430 [Conexibacter sp.]|jgi:hypothetical protein